VKKWLEDSPERAAARAAREAAVAAGVSSVESIRAGYDAGVSVLLSPLEESSRDLVHHAVGLFGRGVIAVGTKDTISER
jgi:hypothetical protein